MRQVKVAPSSVLDRLATSITGVASWPVSASAATVTSSCTVTKNADRPSTVRGLRRIVANVPSRISPTDSGRSGMLPGVTGDRPGTDVDPGTEVDTEAGPEGVTEPGPAPAGRPAASGPGGAAQPPGGGAAALPPGLPPGTAHNPSTPGIVPRGPARHATMVGWLGKWYEG